MNKTVISCLRQTGLRELEVEGRRDEEMYKSVNKNQDESDTRKYKMDQKLVLRIAK